MKVLITGGNGFLARHLLRFLQNKNFELFSITKSEFVDCDGLQITNFCCDITDENLVDYIVNQIKPNVVVHCAAMSKPNDCEIDKQLCIKTNVYATALLAKSSTNHNAHFIFLSTDFVYGEGCNHCEDDECKPMNFYAESKLLAEKMVKQTTNNYTIIRPVFIYGAAIKKVRKTFVQWVADSLLKNQIIQVVDDQIRTPTYVEDICRAIETIINEKQLGTFNLSGSQIITPFEMALKIATLINLDTRLIIPVNENNFNETVKRAKKSIVSIEKANTLLNYNPLSFDEGIKKCFS
jgi:dTDP-4-dehydrorhamnose reductase